MRIAIFTDTFLPQVNGVTNTLKKFGDYLEEQGICYIFITPEQKGEECCPYNVQTFFSTPFLFYPECRVPLPNMLKLNKTMSDFKPDIIFLMTEFTIGLSGLVYGKKHGIPVVSNYSTNFGTILGAYNMNIFEKPLNKYLRWFHGEASLTVTPSDESVKCLHDMGITRCEVFSRGIDADLFSPDKRDHQLRRSYKVDYRIVLLYVGRISAEKDLFMLQEMMNTLNEHYKQRITLMMTGDGPMKKTLKESMPDNVIFTGYKKKEELAGIYASADIFVFPSSFETFGNVVQEAFASGIPVVGVDAGGVRDLIRHDVNGYKARAKDAEDFTRYVEKLIISDMLRYRMGQQGRLFAENRSWTRVFDELLERFDGLIRRRAQARLKEQGSGIA